MFLMGKTSHGHHQIELACSSCHTDPFGGGEVLQDACMSCHGDELKAANDSHPRSKFTDPRNADRLKKIDARMCVSCHVEHRPDKTHEMGVTLPTDFCFHCHQNIAEERPSHNGMGFDTCASAGCHNFHDNLALYEDFLLENAHQPMFKAVANVLTKNAAALHPPQAAAPLSSSDQDGGEYLNAQVLENWQHSSHAQAGVNCSSCHQLPSSAAEKGAWIEKPDHTSCRQCHGLEVDGFLKGMHGMRLAEGLSPMTVAEGEIALREDAAHKSLTCNSCHAAHSFDVQQAAVESCLGCHNSEHVLNFQTSPHAAIARRDDVSAQDIVTCATCHMPRTEQKGRDKRVLVDHNQNANLRPNEKMIRPVCMSCHSLSFSIDALADETLINNNFNGRPTTHIESIDMAVERDKEKAARKSVYN